MCCTMCVAHAVHEAGCAALPCWLLRRAIPPVGFACSIGCGSMLTALSARHVNVASQLPNPVAGLQGGVLHRGEGLAGVQCCLLPFDAGPVCSCVTRTRTKTPPSPSTSLFRWTSACALEATTCAPCGRACRPRWEGKGGAQGRDLLPSDLRLRLSMLSLQQLCSHLHSLQPPYAVVSLPAQEKEMFRAAWIQGEDEWRPYRERHAACGRSLGGMANHSRVPALRCSRMHGCACCSDVVACMVIRALALP